MGSQTNPATDIKPFRATPLIYICHLQIVCIWISTSTTYLLHWMTVYKTLKKRKDQWTGSSFQIPKKGITWGKRWRQQSRTGWRMSADYRGSNGPGDSRPEHCFHTGVHQKPGRVMQIWSSKRVLSKSSKRCITVQARQYRWITTWHTTVNVCQGRPLSPVLLNIIWRALHVRPSMTITLRLPPWKAGAI